MPLRTVLDADTETFELGPYERAVRIRKWVYLFAVTLIAVSNMWVSESQALGWLGVDEVPHLVLRQALLGTVVYFTAQYALVVFQTVYVYRDILERRFGLRSRARLKELQLELDALMRKSRETELAVDESFGDLEARLQHAHQQRDTNEVARLERQLAQKRLEMDSSISAQQRQREQIDDEVRQVVASDHGSKPPVRIAEVTLDVLRLGPPFLVAISALAVGFGLGLR